VDTSTQPWTTRWRCRPVKHKQSQSVLQFTTVM